MIKINEFVLFKGQPWKVDKINQPSYHHFHPIMSCVTYSLSCNGQKALAYPWDIQKYCAG